MVIVSEPKTLRNVITDFRLSRWLIIDVTSYVVSVAMGDIANVSETRAVSMFGVYSAPSVSKQVNQNTLFTWLYCCLQ